MNKPSIEKEIIEIVSKAPTPQEPTQLAKKVGNDPAEVRAAREVIRSLVDRGILKVTLDWKLRAE